MGEQIGITQPPNLRPAPCRPSATPRLAQERCPAAARRAALGFLAPRARLEPELTVPRTRYGRTVRTLAAAALVVAVLTFGACASSGDSDRPDAAKPTSTTVPAGSVEARTDKTVTVAPPRAAVVELVCCEYLPANVTVRGTTPTLFLVNLQKEADIVGVVRRSDLQHDFAIAAASGATLAQSERLALGERATLTLEGIDPGAYSFYCTLPGHAAQGMRGALRVEA